MSLQEISKPLEEAATAAELADTHPQNGNGFSKKLAAIATIASIAVAAVAGLFWLFSVNATANSADKRSSDQAAVIERKADKDEVRQGFEDINKRLDRLQDYLINGAGRKR